MFMIHITIHNIMEQTYIIFFLDSES